MKLRNEVTGATVDVSEDTAALLPSEYKADEAEKKPAAKRAASSKSDK